MQTTCLFPCYLMCTFQYRYSYWCITTISGHMVPMVAVYPGNVYSRALNVNYMYTKLAVTVHRCLNGRAPPYLSDYCVPVAGVDTRQHLRSAKRQLLAVPRYRLNTYGCWAFSVAGPTAWNSLPDFIRDPTTSADCFRRLLKTYLFARY